MRLSDRLAQWLLGWRRPQELRRLASETVATFNTVTVSDWYQRNGYDHPAFFGGHQSYTGRSVNQESALELPAMYAGVKMVAEDIGSLPRHVYRFNKDWTATEKDRGTRLYRIMHNLWNPEVNAGEAVEALTCHAILTGRGLAGIQRETKSTRTSEIVYLWPWMPADCYTDRDSRKRLIYKHKEDSQWKTYQMDEVFHLKGFSITGYDGDDLIKRAVQSLGLYGAQQEFAGRAFANGIHADLFFEHPGGEVELTPKGVDAIQKEFLGKRGLGAVDVPFVCREGMQAKRLPVDMEKWQLTQAQLNSVLSVCQWLRLPPHKLAILNNAIKSNIEEESIGYVVYTLLPWNRRWKEAFYRCLLTVDEQIADRLYLEHDFAGLLKGNFKAQTEGFRALLEKGVMSINEVRRLLNFNPIPGGDEHHIQLNMTAVGQAADEVSQETDDDAMARLLGATSEERKLLTGGLYRVH